MTPVLLRRLWSTRLTVVLVAAAGVLAALALRTYGPLAASDSQNHSEFTPVDAIPTGERGGGNFAQPYAAMPRQLTPEECREAAPRMEGLATLLTDSVKDQKAESKARLATAIQRSRGWFADGCPPDARLGYYDATDGSGAIKAVLIDFP